MGEYSACQCHREMQRLEPVALDDTDERPHLIHTNWLDRASQYPGRTGELVDACVAPDPSAPPDRQIPRDAVPLDVRREVFLASLWADFYVDVSR